MPYPSFGESIFFSTPLTQVQRALISMTLLSRILKYCPNEPLQHLAVLLLPTLVMWANTISPFSFSTSTSSSSNSSSSSSISENAAVGQTKEARDVLCLPAFFYDDVSTVAVSPLVAPSQPSLFCPLIPYRTSSSFDISSSSS